jgi:hypothetical protein
MAVALAVLAFGASLSEAASFEYPYLYKSPRIMAMGGANVAIGGTFASVFHNPAGIGTMPTANFEVNLIGLDASLGDNVQDFTEDLQDALDVNDSDGDGDDADDQLIAVNDVLAQYRGDNMHLGLNNLSSVALNTGLVAAGGGVFGGFNLDAASHQGFGLDGLLEANATMDLGGIGAVSYKVMDRLYLGAALKVVSRDAVIHTFTARELVENEDDIEGYITDELREKGTGFGADVGAIYEFYKDSVLRPTVGLSVLNIGDMDFGDAGEVPMTVNIGVAVNPKVPVIHGLTVGLDYVDLFNNYDVDDDIAKRIRIGGDVRLYDSSLFDLGMQAGLYQGYPTFGIDARIMFLKVMYATYAEEVGAYAGQSKDRRQVLALNIGW